jgi:hypothetical protein
MSLWEKILLDGYVGAIKSVLQTLKLSSSLFKNCSLRGRGVICVEKCLIFIKKSP